MDIYVVKEEVIDRSRGGRRGDCKARKDKDEEKIRKEKVKDANQKNAYTKMRDGREVDLEKGVSMGPIAFRNPKKGVQMAPEIKENRQKPGMVRIENAKSGSSKPPAMLLAPLSPKAIALDGKKSMDLKSSGSKSMDLKSSASGGNKSTDLKSSSSTKKSPPPLPQSRTPGRVPEGGKHDVQKVVSPGLQLPSLKMVLKDLPALPSDTSSGRN
jgi:hypothetical protein